jgi:hypothetical protein
VAGGVVDSFSARSVSLSIAMLAAMTAKVFRQCGQCDWTETSTKIGHVATGHHIHMVLSAGQGEAWTVGVGFDDWVD